MVPNSKVNNGGGKGNEWCLNTRGETIRLQKEVGYLYDYVGKYDFSYTDVLSQQDIIIT